MFHDTSIRCSVDISVGNHRQEFTVLSAFLTPLCRLLAEGRGRWLTSGCSLANQVGELSVIHCSQLTSVAVMQVGVPQGDIFAPRLHQLKRNEGVLCNCSVIQLCIQRPSLNTSFQYVLPAKTVLKVHSKTYDIFEMITTAEKLKVAMPATDAARRSERVTEMVARVFQPRCCHLRRHGGTSGLSAGHHRFPDRLSTVSNSMTINHYFKDPDMSREAGRNHVQSICHRRPWPVPFWLPKIIGTCGGNSVKFSYSNGDSSSDRYPCNVILMDGRSCKSNSNCQNTK